MQIVSVNQRAVPWQAKRYEMTMSQTDYYRVSENFIESPKS